MTRHLRSKTADPTPHDDAGPSGAQAQEDLVVMRFVHAHHEPGFVSFGFRSELEASGSTKREVTLPPAHPRGRGNVVEPVRRAAQAEVSGPLVERVERWRRIAQEIPKERQLVRGEVVARRS